jgi:hypothetical protein
MRILPLSGVVLVVALVFAVPAVPSGQAPQSLVTPFEIVTTMVIKHGLVPDFEEYRKKVVAAEAKLGGAPRFLVYQCVQGGSPNIFVAKRPFSKLADLDAPPRRAMAKMYGEAEAAKMAKAAQAMYEKFERTTYRLLPTVSSSLNKTPEAPPFLFVVYTELKPGWAPAYESLTLRLLKTAQEQAPGFPVAIRRVSAEGPSWIYWTEQPFSNHAERDTPGWQQPDLRKFFSDAEVRQSDNVQLQGVVRRVISVLRFRPELSTGVQPT